MAQEQVYDVVVVGQGLMGSCAVQQMLERSPSLRVLALEQFDLGHGRGSSHGYSRIVRTIYPQPHFTDMAKISMGLWHELERQSGEKFIITTGEIDFGEDLASLEAIVKQKEIPHRAMNGQEASRRWPGLHIPDHYRVIHTFDAGLVQASKALRVVRERARAAGAEFRDNHRVVAVEERPDGTVAVTCESALDGLLHRFLGRKLLLAPGAWLKPMLRQHFGLDINLRVIQVGYWYFHEKEKCVPDDVYNHRRFPVWIKHGPSPFYGTPAYEMPHMLKIGAHANPVDTTADTRTFKPVKALEELVKKEVALHFIGCDSEPSLAETCLYSVTHNEDFILSPLPAHPNVIVAGGGSGHAFKHGPAIGQMLAELVLDGHPITPAYQYPGFRVETHLQAASRL